MNKLRVYVSSARYKGEESTNQLRCGDVLRGLVNLRDVKRKITKNFEGGRVVSGILQSSVP
jgi:hypothetical protein